MKKVYPNKEFCIGCHICELACATAHSKSGDLIIAWKEERAEGLSPCKSVVHRGPMTVALSCRHCADAFCVAACISGALHKDSEGRTAYDEDKCVGCWSCLMACPYGAIHRHPFKEKIVKCDLCAGRDQPACVQACPNKALLYRDED
jgi:carbon-monoxide dehydrogenase iron sulfur subunit